MTEAEYETEAKNRIRGPRPCAVAARCRCPLPCPLSPTPFRLRVRMASTMPVDLPEPFCSALARNDAAAVSDAEAVTAPELYARGLARSRVGRDAAFSIFTT